MKATTNTVFLRVVLSTNQNFHFQCLISNDRLYSEKVHCLYHALGSSHELYLVAALVLWWVRTYRRSCSVGKFMANPLKVVQRYPNRSLLFAVLTVYLIISLSE